MPKAKSFQTRRHAQSDGVVLRKIPSRHCVRWYVDSPSRWPSNHTIYRPRRKRPTTPRSQASYSSRDLSQSVAPDQDSESGEKHPTRFSDAHTLAVRCREPLGMPTEYLDTHLPEHVPGSPSSARTGWCGRLGRRDLASAGLSQCRWRLAEQCRAYIRCGSGVYGRASSTGSRFVI